MKYIIYAILVFLFVSCSGATLDRRMSDAEALEGVGDHQGALKIYRVVADGCPGYGKCAQVLFRIADLETNTNGNFDEALKAYEKIIEYFPLKEAGRVAYERSANIYELKKDYVGAAEEYAQLLKYFYDSPGTPRYLLRLGQSYLSMGNLAQSRTELESLLDYQKCDPEIREEAIFTYAESYFLEGRLGLAEKAYQKLVDEYPNSKLAPEARMKIATCQEERGLLGEATSTMAEVKKEYPNQPVIEDRLKAMQKRGREKPRDKDL